MFVARKQSYNNRVAVCVPRLHVFLGLPLLLSFALERNSNLFQEQRLLLLRGLKFNCCPQQA
jgi:hypothetical protein